MYRINVSDNKVNYGQRNNEIDPLNSCNCTSMVMALDYLGYQFPSGKYTQPEDNLQKFMESKGLVKFNHGDLVKGVNTWLGKEVDTFSVSVPISKLIEEVVAKRPCVVSGTFPGHPTVKKSPLGHIVVLVGFEWDGDGPIGQPSAAIIDDPYGNTMDDWKGSGNDVVLPWPKWISWLKPCGDETKKWAHLFKPI